MQDQPRPAAVDEIKIFDNDDKAKIFFSFKCLWPCHY